MKKPASLCLVALTWLAVARAEPWRLAMTVEDSNGNEYGANIVFDDGKAYEYGPEITVMPEAIFDLSRQEWVESAGSRRMTLTSAKAWAETTKARSLSSLGRAGNPDERAFVQLLIEPAFEVTGSPESLTLASRFITYTAATPLALAAEQLQALWSYDELNAYRKAMKPGQMPPFMQLKVTEHFKEKGFYPGMLNMKLVTPHGAVTVVITYRMAPLSATEIVLFGQGRP